ncbi:ATP-binding protein [Vibrio agarivorans]|uniref:ATP-binding protein n=1 Tax=Vibrio agarivorans TaxID=153622 RepID=A0ABT7XZ78_9VIBR|nr:ATP-binding protein [Vibrio agarivorans]MDN2481079.1 ATP-binding protein [Vibrio agarivorans]
MRLGWILLLALLSHTAHALGLQQIEQPVLSKAAVDIEQQVVSFPEPLFMEGSHYTLAKQVLITTLEQINTEAAQFQQTLDSYRAYRDEESWKQASQSFYNLQSLNQSKQKLIDIVSSNVRDEVTGFGPIGVTQVKSELHLIRLNAEFMLYYQLDSFKAFINDLLISPIPIIWVALKVLLVFWVLIWWLRNRERLITKYREVYLDNQTNPHVIHRAIWYVTKADKSLAWLVALTLSLRIISALPSLQHLVFLEIFTWWILGGSIAVSLLLEVTYRHSRHTSPELKALRLSTIRYYVWTFIITGVVLQISMRTLGKGTIYHWIVYAFVAWFGFITLLTLNRWRYVVFERIASLSGKPNAILWAEAQSKHWLMRFPATFLAICWLILYRFKHQLVSSLSNYAVFSQVLAYLFRVEVAKQSGDVSTDSNFARLKGKEVFNYVTPGNEESELIDYGNEELKKLAQYLLTDKPAFCIISGERGIGSTTIQKQLLHRVKNATPFYINCPYDGYRELLADLAKQLELSETTEDLEAAIYQNLLHRDTPVLIVVDNAQRLVKPKVGGLASLIKLTQLLRSTGRKHRFLLSIEKASWRFVDRARGERLIFDWVTFLPRWSEKQIHTLLETRVNQSNDNAISFEGIVVPKQWEQDDTSEEQRAKQGFYRILWHYSDGNPTVALRFMRYSLHRDKTNNEVVVRLFKAPSSDELEKMPKPMLAVLRSIVQLEVAAPDEVAECTQLSLVEVTGVLRFFQSRGLIEFNEQQARISDHWFRYITNVLDRQHLLVK